MFPPSRQLGRQVSEGLRLEARLAAVGMIVLLLLVLLASAEPLGAGWAAPQDPARVPLRLAQQVEGNPIDPGTAETRDQPAEEMVGIAWTTVTVAALMLLVVIALVALLVVWLTRITLRGKRR